MILNPPIRLISGTGNHPVAQEVAKYLDLPLCSVKISQFSDGEIYVKLQESVRGSDVFIIQPTCHPVNYNLMELLVLMDACRRASAHSITAVIPYYGYARQDRITAGREAITAKLVANLLATAGATRVVAVDLHAAQIQGFFDIVTDHLFATPVFVDYINSKKFEDLVIVSPDVGGVARARHFAKRFNAPIAIIDKRRPEANKAEVLHVIGDVKDKTVILYDDMVDTAGTITEGARLIMKNGAKRVLAVATHGVLSGPAIERIQNSPLEELIITNTIPLTPEKQIDKIKSLSVAPLLGEAIHRIYEGASVSTLFE